jgi:hypothetical protein
LNGGDRALVHRELVGATTLKAQIRKAVPGAAVKVATAFGACKDSYANLPAAAQKTVVAIVGWNVYRQTVRDGMPAYARFARSVTAGHPADKRLHTAIAGVKAELAQGRAFAAVPVDICADLVVAKAAGFPADILKTLLDDLLGKAHLTQRQSDAADALVHASRPAVVAAGLTGTQATALLHAEDASIFGDVVFS